jgi:hypothetical protein
VHTTPPPIDADLAAAIARAALDVRRVENITTAHFPSHRRATYRVELASGETIKARVVDDETTARRVFEMRRDLPDAFVPAFVRDGCVLFERWIDGDLLGDATPPDARIAEAAALLAGVHAVRRPNVGAAPGHANTAARRNATERGLGRLTETGAIDARDAVRLADDLSRADPHDAATGLTHLDFCGENMLVDRAGRLRVFDNERVGVDHLGFDLARTWYRWALPPEGWTTFVRAYAPDGPADASIPDFTFWAIVALVHSACLRLDAAHPHAARPIERLRRLARGEAVAARS